ncbi:MAG: hypothetical protein H6858_01705 [Rhodospirillales bacterium]|nr:hypothetical protein [Alphaproteobacteria bacterium]MCB9976298.1 hypothetical protein [Rhodospirillales bacterium]
MRKKRRLIALVALFLTVSMGIALSMKRQSRLSAAVAFLPESPELLLFLKKPGLAYAQGYVRFPAGMPDDVILFLDIEMLEGLKSPLWVKGGDWMSYVGLQRTGAVWVTAGTDSTMKGTPSKDRKWEIRSLDQKLQPDTWYRVRVSADFSARHFVSFEIEGGGLSKTIDLSKVTLDYPNYMPFDRGGVIVIPGAMRGRGMMKEDGEPIAYFDDIEAGIVLADGTLKPLFTDGFETQDTLQSQPITLPAIKLDNYKFGYWYKERDEALFSVEEQSFARSGKKVGAANATLEEF